MAACTFPGPHSAPVLKQVASAMGLIMVIAIIISVMGCILNIGWVCEVQDGVIKSVFQKEVYCCMLSNT